MTHETPGAKARRIAAAQAARVHADSQGKPTGKPTRYTYDSSGLLISAEPDPDDAA